MAADTIFALSSGRPPAAIAVIRISGPGAHTAGERLAGTLPKARRAAVRELKLHDGTLLDSALVLRFDGPASATGEDIVEFHCHGGRAVADAVLTALADIEGLRSARPGEFTRRAFENGRIDLTEAEGLADLLEAETESQRRAAVAVADGDLRRQIECWQAQIVLLSARAEAAIDYVDEDSVEHDALLAAECAELASNLRSWLEQPRAEPLKDGLKVVIAGPPNAGKSSLLNALAGVDKAIVTSIPGTTRDQIDVPIAVAGVPIVLTDTAGLRESGDPVERIGIERAHAASAAADIVIWLGEPREAPRHPRVIHVHPRSDLAGRGSAPDGALPVSSVTGEGIGALLRGLGDVARTLLPGEGAIALNRRQADHLEEAREALEAAADALEVEIAAHQLQLARTAFDRITGRADIGRVLDALFGRFCLGK